MSDNVAHRPRIAKRMIAMVVGVLLLVALIVGAKVLLVMRTIASLPKPTPATVSTTVARYQAWQPALNSVGTLRAVQGAELALDVPGLVSRIKLQSGQRVEKGQLLLQLRDADDVPSWPSSRPRPVCRSSILIAPINSWPRMPSAKPTTTARPPI